MPDFSDERVTDPVADAMNGLLNAVGQNAILSAVRPDDNGTVLGAVLIVTGPLAAEVVRFAESLSARFEGPKTGRYYDPDGESTSLADIERAADG